MTMENPEIRLNLGCGGRPLPGYRNVDMDPLEVLQSRYPQQKIKRVLRPGGIFRFSTPDFEDAVGLWLAAKDDRKDFFRSDPET